MARRGNGWTRRGSKGSFRYEDERGREITEPAKLERIRSLAVPPAWKDVWISSRPRAKLQATGVDRAGRTQYLYHPDYRAAQEEAKYARLVRFGERLPGLRARMAADLRKATLDRDRVSAVALSLIAAGWFRAGSDRYARNGSYGVTTLTKRHVRVRGRRITVVFRGKGRARVRSELADGKLAAALAALLEVPGGPRLFRYESDGELSNLTNARLNAYVKTHLGEGFSAKDFRTWGGTLLAALAFAEWAARDGFPEGAAAEKRAVAAVMRRVSRRLGNTPAVCRASYVSPAVIEEYRSGRTIRRFGPRRQTAVPAPPNRLSAKERALLGLLRSWHSRRARAAA